MGGQSVSDEKFEKEAFDALEAIKGYCVAADEIIEQAFYSGSAADPAAYIDALYAINDSIHTIINDRTLYLRNLLKESAAK